jgi:hypothetical protein
LRWERQGDGANPGYFVGAGPESGPESLRLESHAASHVAHFITQRVADGINASGDDLPDADLDKYSLEIIATYLEDHGYIVTSPE